MNRKLVFAMIVSIGAGCATLPQGVTLPTGLDEITTETPDIVPIDDQSASQQMTTGLENCSRVVERSDGDLICIDALLAVLFADSPRDNDGDGVPNINDDDIDGDGIPNGFDLDVDGDGLPNSTDDDIDDDGVPNEDDVDIDGDFLRNRWDPDMDGDLLYNGRDPDADGDGKLKFPELDGAECGPVDLFNDPEACGEGCNSDTDDAGSAGTVGQGSGDGDDSNAADSMEDECDDKGKQKVDGDPSETGQNLTLYDLLIMERNEETDPDAATTWEADGFGDELDSLFLDDPPSPDELRDVDPDATTEEILDADMMTLDAVTDVENPQDTGILTGVLPEAAEAEFRERRESIRMLAELPDVDLGSAVDVTGRFSAAVRDLSAALGDLVETALAIDASFPETEILSDGEMAVSLVAIADVADIPIMDVPQAIGPTARSANTIGNEEVVESVWRIVVDQVSAYRNEDDSIAFSLVRVAQATERIAGLLDEPTIESVNESLANILEATDAFKLTDPLAVVERLESLAAADPSLSVSDGIDAGEASLAADDVHADAP